ncbi:MAG TPA: hypothetical protein VKX46_10525, partial [Ktedonobacteraceae bacterium]|nr:hypothetical protein [Ktedonobacteraceae bacterium]
GFSLTDGMITTVLGAIFVMVVLATAWHALERRWIILLLLGPFALTFALALVDVYPYSSTRQDIYLTVPMVLLVAWGITAAWSFHIVSPKHLPLQAALIALVAVVGLLYPLARDTRNYLRSPGDEVITKALAALKRNQRAQDLVYVAIDAVPAYIYYTCHAASCASALLAVGDKFAMDRILPSTTIGPVIIGQAPHGAPADNRYLPAQVRSLARRGRRVWFLFSHTDVVALTRILTLVHTYGSTVRYVVAPGSSLYLFTPSVTR